MKFILEIELGNDAMQSGEDVARALKRAAEFLRAYDEGGLQKDGLSSSIRDLYGNTVGKWQVKG